jgi:hypothetical protein
VEAGYSFRLTRFDALPPPAAMLHNGDEHDFLAAAAWRAGRSDDLRFGYRLQYFTADGDNLALTNSPAVGWRHQIVHALELHVEAGPLFYDNMQGGSGTSVSWRGNGLLRWFTPGWRASIGYLHDLVGGTGAASVLWADWLYGQVGYHFGDVLDVHGGAGWFQNGLAPSQSPLYEGVNVDLIADWRVISNLRLAGYYSFRFQELVAPMAGVAPFEPVTRHVVGIRLYAVIGAEAQPPRREVLP